MSNDATDAIRAHKIALLHDHIDLLATRHDDEEINELIDVLEQRLYRRLVQTCGLTCIGRALR